MWVGLFVCFLSGGCTHFVNQHYSFWQKYWYLQNQWSAEGGFVQLCVTGCWKLSWLPNYLNTSRKPRFLLSHHHPPHSCIICYWGSKPLLHFLDNSLSLTKPSNIHDLALGKSWYFSSTTHCCGKLSTKHPWKILDDFWVMGKADWWYVWSNLDQDNIIFLWIVQFVLSSLQNLGQFSLELSSHLRSVSKHNLVP